MMCCCDFRLRPLSEFDCLLERNLRVDVGVTPKSHFTEFDRSMRSDVRPPHVNGVPETLLRARQLPLFLKDHPERESGEASQEPLIVQRAGGTEGAIGTPSAAELNVPPRLLKRRLGAYVVTTTVEQQTQSSRRVLGGLRCFSRKPL